MSENRVCLVCSVSFVPSAPKQLYCGKRCAWNAADRRRAGKRIQNAPDVSEEEEAELYAWARRELRLRVSGDKPAGGVMVGACGSRICEAGCRREGGAKCQV